MKVSNLCNLSKSKEQEKKAEGKKKWGEGEIEKEDLQKSKLKRRRRKKKTLVTNSSPAFGKKCRNRPTGKKREANQSNKIYLS